MFFCADSVLRTEWRLHCMCLRRKKNRRVLQRAEPIENWQRDARRTRWGSEDTRLYTCLQHALQATGLLLTQMCALEGLQRPQFSVACRMTSTLSCPGWSLTSSPTRVLHP